jgi:flagellar hook-associated protein 2
MIPASATRGDSPYEMLIKSIITIEGQPKQKLLGEKKDQERLKNVMSDFSKKLTDLQAAIKKLSDPITPMFGARTGSTTSSTFTVSATDRASLGNHTIEIQRLATSDTRVSRQFDRTGSDLSALAGQHTFSIEVFSPTSADPDRRVPIDVTADIQAGQDSDILDQVRTAIADAMRTAADAGTIKHTEIPSASLVNETSTTSRLSLRSSATGFEGRLSFTDSQSGLLAALQIGHDGLVDGTSGGQTRLVGTSETDSELNARFVLDGLTLYRSSNRVTDALPGVSLDLRQVSPPGGEAFSVDVDSESVKEGVTDFIKKYNDLLTYIESKSRVDADSNTRGDFAGDSSIRSLRMSLRNEMVRAVGGVPGDFPTSIADLGITIERDGKLTLSDESKLAETVAANRDGVQAMFAGSDGLAGRLEAHMERFLGSGGLISERQKGIDTRIKRLDDRVKAFETTLSRREDSLRLQFAKMQESIAVLQGQQNFFLSFFQNAYGGNR